MSPRKGDDAQIVEPKIAALEGTYLTNRQKMPVKKAHDLPIEDFPP